MYINMKDEHKYEDFISSTACLLHKDEIQVKIHTFRKRDHMFDDWGLAT